MFTHVCLYIILYSDPTILWSLEWALMMNKIEFSFKAIPAVDKSHVHIVISSMLRSTQGSSYSPGSKITSAERFSLEHLHTQPAITRKTPRWDIQTRNPFASELLQCSVRVRHDRSHDFVENWQGHKNSIELDPVAGQNRWAEYHQSL